MTETRLALGLSRAKQNHINSLRKTSFSGTIRNKKGEFCSLIGGSNFLRNVTD